ncbi:MAG: 16S rRNA (cytidine(1402)-2'-O)-methyltransferase [Anaerolineales bacterium]|nr:16S rRNA (cytidine(1402)-2'-O)-methyltransferase [Anaerolineales bacterium]
MGTLFLVATPIGNLEDISTRALRILSEVQIIAAEDTRHSAKLLEKYQIKTPTTSYHEHSKEGKLKLLLNILEQGDIALITDAGTPSLNDPGYELVQAVIKAGHKISPIPGASAPIAALVASGLPTDKFLYLGYLPRKSAERRRLLEEISHLPYTLVLLETPHRLISALKDCGEVLGERQVAIARELTKLHEEIFRGTIHQALTHFETEKPRGEFTLVLRGNVPIEREWTQEELLSSLRKELKQGKPISKVSSQIASQSGWPRREVYKLANEIQSNKKRE